MDVSTNTTLAALAVRLPGASRVFRRYGLDYCCAGHRALADACAAKNLDAAAVLAEVERESTGASAELPSFADRPLTEVIAHVLEHYHEPLKVELPELIAMAQRVETRHGDKPSCPRGLAQHLEGMHAELSQHLAKEERILFPMIQMGGGAGAGGPITVMTREHDDHGAALRRTRELTTDLVPPAGACATWRALYLRLEQLEKELMDHIHLENNILFPRALRG